MKIFFNASYLMAGNSKTTTAPGAGDLDYVYGRYITGPDAEDCPGTLFGIPAERAITVQLDAYRTGLIKEYCEYCDALMVCGEQEQTLPFGEWFIVGGTMPAGFQKS